MELNIKEIMDIIPHRYPFLLIDKIVEFEEGSRAVGLKNVTMNEPFFQGHFPWKSNYARSFDLRGSRPGWRCCYTEQTGI